MSKNKKTSAKKNKRRYTVTKRLNNTYGTVPLDIIKERLNKEIHLPFNEEEIGNGQFYCRECDRFFLNSNVLSEHKKNKKHKKRVKELNSTMHKREDAELAGGLYRELKK